MSKKEPCTEVDWWSEGFEGWDEWWSKWRGAIAAGIVVWLAGSVLAKSLALALEIILYWVFG